MNELKAIYESGLRQHGKITKHLSSLALQECALVDVRPLTWNKVYISTSDGKTKICPATINGEEQTISLNFHYQKKALNCLKEKEDPNEPDNLTLPGTPNGMVTTIVNDAKMLENKKQSISISFHNITAPPCHTISPR